MLQWFNGNKGRNIAVNGTVYIYVSQPISAIMFKCIVTKVDLEEITMDHSPYIIDGSDFENYGKYMKLELTLKYESQISIEQLRSIGLSGNIQGPRKVEGEIAKQLGQVSAFNELAFEESLDSEALKEGKAISIQVNR